MDRGKRVSIVNMNMGLQNKNNERNHVIETYFDSDWSGNQLDRKTVTGSVGLYNTKVVAWLSRKQNCVALSTVEAEYTAAANYVCDLIKVEELAGNLKRN